MKNNIKFLLKITVVLVLAVCLVVGASFVYKSGPTYEGTYSGIEKYDNVPSDIDFANFGPSYGMNCFNYETIQEKGKTGFNFSLTMQDLYHDYALYKTYEENFSDGAIVAVPLSYFSFCSSTTSPTGNRYYKMLDRAYIKEYTLEKEVSTKYMPAYGNGKSLVRDLTNDFLNAIIKKSVATDSDKPKEEAKTEQSEKIAKLEKDSKSRVLTIENGNLKTLSNHIPANEEILVNWISEMQAKGLKPVLLLTPYWHDYAHGFDEELLNTGYTAPVSRVIEKTGVDYIDFCSEEYSEYINTPEYFTNCDHVSKEGSKAFMKLYVNWLEEKGWIK